MVCNNNTSISTTKALASGRAITLASYPLPDEYPTLNPKLECAEAFRKLLNLEGVSEEGLDAWAEGLPTSVPDLRLTELSHHLTLALLAAAHASWVTQHLLSQQLVRLLSQDTVCLHSIPQHL
jgi:hypothetical protein